MITLTKLNDSIKFTFSQSDHYLFNGEIEVPLNSLALVIDESDMITFRKASSNDVFISANISEFGMDKAALEQWYMENMVDSGISEEEVEEAINTALSYYYDMDEVDNLIENFYDGVEYDSTNSRINFKHGTTIKGYIDATPFIVDGMVSNVEVLNGYLVITFNVDSGKQPIQISLTDIFNPSNYYTKTDVNGLLANKQDTLVAGSGITIENNVISAEGGGKAINAGRGISITTGETADTINCTLPIVDWGNSNIAFTDKGYGSGNHTLSFGDGASTPSFYSMSLGNFTNARGDYSVAIGYGGRTNARFSNAFGYYTVTNNERETAQGVYNNSVSASTTFGDSGNTLFSVGNGTAGNARHNAFEIRQNGDIYLTLDGQDVKLQDQLGGGGSSYTAGDGIDITNDVISVTGKVDTSAFTAHTADTVIHVTSAEKAAWNAKSDFSGDYNDLTNKPTIPTVPTSNTAFTNDAGYITSSALDGYATTGDVQTATADMATKTWVGNQGYLTEHQSLSNYYTKSETSGATEISIALASKADTATTYTKTEVDTALASKQTTLTAGTNITIVDNVISAEGGSSYTAGNGIYINKYNTISLDVPIYKANSNSCYVGDEHNYTNTISGDYSFAIGLGNKVSGKCSVAIGGFSYYPDGNSAIENNTCAIGRGNEAKSFCSTVVGYYNNSSNYYETDFGRYNNSVSASTTFGDSGNTLFSVGNGTSSSARHNAFEIRQNGDIYLTLDGQDVKLQDQLGGGGSSVNVVQTTGTSTDDVMSQNAVTTQLNNKANQSSAVGSYTLGSNSNGDYLQYKSVNNYNINNALFYPKINGKGILTTNDIYAKNNYNFQLVETSAITTSVTSSSTDSQVPSAKAVYDQFGGLKLVKLTQAEYDALATKDSQTLYIVTDS